MRRNSTTTYGSVSKFFHWSIALGIIVMIPLGIIANGMADADPLKPTLFSAHKTLGILIFFLAIARIIWAITSPKPGALHPERRAETYLAAIVHWLLYASLVLVPLSGWVHHAATTGFAPIWWPFGQGLPFVPVSDSLAHTSAALHIIFERVLVLSLLLHIAGALKHHLIDRDDTLRRMLPGHTEPQLTPKQSHARTAPVAALAVLATALGIGTALNLFQHDEIEAVALEQVNSDWQVQEGTLSITVRQLGSDVTGQFADWTAAIQFDETADADGKHGSVEVTVAIPSLTLGSVTSQAMGADFFDAEAHSTATYMADIFGHADSFIARGTLTIREQSAPLDLPFMLTIDGDTARMEGQTSISRLAFGIGAQSQPNEGSLAYDVVIDVGLTATR